MKRRDFLKATAASAVAAGAGIAGCSNNEQSNGKDDNVASKSGNNSKQDPVTEADDCCRTYADVKAAMNSPRETLAYVPVIYAGTHSTIEHPDVLATIDVDPSSKTYGKIVNKLEMPIIGDELHHFGWNSCSSCHGVEGKHRRFIVLPGIASSRIHIVDTEDPRKPKMHKVIEPKEVKKVGLSAPHTVHCLADGNIMISCLGDAEGNAPGGFLLMNEKFEVTGRWEKDATGMNFNYDYWYQPRHNVMVSSEWGAPNTVSKGFHLEDVKAGKYGRHLHFWDWKERTINQSIDLGETGMIPLEVRFHHNPDSANGFVGAALSSTMWHFNKKDSADKWAADKVISVDSVPDVEGWPFPVPGLITDLVLSMDDKWLYFSNWLHGDLRQYDVSDPANPKLTGQVWLGGVIGHKPDFKPRMGKPLDGGPQMLQLSLDGKRLYVTNSLYSPWDNQFYPGIKENGSYMLQLDCDTEKGGMTVNEDFYINFDSQPAGPARAHEMRFPGGDCTSDIFV